MDKVWPIVVTMLIALLAVAIAYRVKALHKLVFGKGSAHLNEAAAAAIKSNPQVAV
jgi:hypothetical protein